MDDAGNDTLPVADKPSEELVKQVMRLVMDVADQGRDYVDAVAREFDLTRVQAGVLMHLGQPIAMNELASVLACERSNVTGLVDRLEKRQLVAREPDARDRRVKTLVLTPSGERTRDELSRRLFEDLPILNRLTTPEVGVLGTLLQKLAGDSPERPTGITTVS